MKNVLIVFLILIIVVMAGYFLLNNNSTADKDLLSYSYSDGALSFKYPSNYDILEKEGLIEIVTKGEKPVMDAQIAIVNYPNYIPQVVKSGKAVVEDVPSKTFKMIKISQAGYPGQGSSRILYLDDSENPSNFIVFSSTPKADGLTEDQLDSIFKSFVIDKEKALVIAQKTMADAKEKALEARLTSSLASIRPAAEIFYDQKKSYVGMCNPLGNSQGEKYLKEQYQYIEDVIGKENMVCLAKLDSYSVSIKLDKPKTIKCVDSSGYFGTISEVAKGYSCK
jgi:hypothetical protein